VLVLLQNVDGYALPARREAPTALKVAGDHKSAATPFMCRSRRLFPRSSRRRHTARRSRRDHLSENTAAADHAAGESDGGATPLMPFRADSPRIRRHVAGGPRAARHRSRGPADHKRHSDGPAPTGSPSVLC